MNEKISAAAKAQSIVSNEVSENVIKISHLTEHTTDGASQISTASQELMTLATHLQKVAGQFKV